MFVMGFKGTKARPKCHAQGPLPRTQKLILKLFPTQSRLLTTLKKKALENNMGKGENAGNQHFFLLFPQCFLVHQREKSSF